MISHAKSVYAVQYVYGQQHILDYLVSTHDHPYWIEGLGWTAAESLRAGQSFQLADGNAAKVIGAAQIFTTQIPNVGVARDIDNAWEVALDLSQDEITLIDRNDFDLPTLESQQEFASPVFNFEVDDLHTYYVGEVGVWVHNSNCQEESVGGAITKEIAKENLSEACFVAGTLVHTRDGLKPIEEIKVGDWVMTNAEDSVKPKLQVDAQDPIYRQVIETFVTDDMPIVELRYVQPDGEYGYLQVTPSHPIMLKKHGWMAAKDLRYGHVLMLGYWGNVILGKNKPINGTARVYNIKVDEFHTYFVGKYGVWVHNCGHDVDTVTHLPELSKVEEKTRLYEDREYLNLDEKDSNANTGKQGRKA